MKSKGIILRRLISLLMPMLMLASLTGCGGSKTDEATAQAAGKATGCYVESENTLDFITAGQYVNNFFTDPQDNIFFWGYDDSGTLIYQSDGKKLGVEWSKSDLLRSSVVMDIFCGDDGNLYSLLFNYGENAQSTSSLLRISEDGSSAEDVTPKDWSETNDGLKPFVQKCRVTPDGAIVCFSLGQGLEVYSGSKHTELVSHMSDTEAFDVCGNKVYYTSSSTDEIVCYDISSETVEKFTTDFSLLSAAICAGADSIRVISSDGIYLRSYDGTIWECVADGNRYKFGLPSNKIYDAAITTDGTIYSCLSDVQSGNRTIYKYVFDETIDVSADKKLTVYSMWYSPTIREGVVKFNELHPEATIDYTVAYDGSGTPIADRIRSLNTELMSGNGADILILNGLPANSYIKSGVLEDISDIMKPLADNGDILGNIAKNYISDDGKIYCMPIRFAPQFMFCDKAAAKLGDTSPVSFVDFANSCSNSGNVFIPGIQGTEFLTENFLYKFYDTLINESGEIDKAKYAEFITSLKAINDVDKQGTGFGSRDTEETVQRQYLNSQLGDIFNIMIGDTHAAYASVRDIDQMVFYEQFKEEFEISCLNVRNKYVAGSTISINSSSPEKELAREFVSYMFTAEAQKSELGDGLPTCSAALDALFDADSNIKYDNGNYSVGISSSSDSKYLEYVIKWPTAEQRTDAKALCTSADSPAFDDITLIEMLCDSAEDYFAGNCTAETAAENAASSMNMYLSEQS